MGQFLVAQAHSNGLRNLILQTQVFNAILILTIAVAFAKLCKTTARKINSRDHRLRIIYGAYLPRVSKVERRSGNKDAQRRREGLYPD